MKDFLKTSVTIIQNCMIFALPEEISDESVEIIREFIVQKAGEREIRGAILNFATVKVIDNFIFDSFYQTSMALELIGVESLWVNLKPPVIVGMMDLNIDFSKILNHTSFNVESGLAYLVKKYNI